MGLGHHKADSDDTGVMVRLLRRSQGGQRNERMPIHPVDTGRHGALVLHERYDKSGNGSDTEVQVSGDKDEIPCGYDPYLRGFVEAVRSFFHRGADGDHLCNSGTFPRRIHITATYIYDIDGGVFHLLELVRGDAVIDEQRF